MSQQDLPSLDIDKSNVEWMELEQSVHTAFDYIVDQVNERRTVLLNKIRNLFAKKQHILRSIKQIENTKSLVQDQLRENNVNQLLQKNLADFKRSSTNFETEACHESNYRFFCDLKEFSRTLASLGSIDKAPMPYLSKNDVKFSFPKMKNLISPTRLSVNEDLGLICVSDHKGKQLLLFKLDGSYINFLKLDQLKCPVSMKLITKNEIIVSDYALDSIFRIEFDLHKNNKCKILCSKNYLHVTCLDYDEDSDFIYFTASLFGSLQILTRTNLKVAGKIDHSFIFPRSVTVKKSEIFVLDCNNPCIHVLSKSTHEITRSIIPQGIDLNFSNPLGFTVDDEGRIIVSDFHGTSNQIQVYSPLGQLLHSFPDKVSVLFQPASIHVTRDYDVIVIWNDPDTPIQVF